MHHLTDTQRLECLSDLYAIVGSLAGYNEAKSFLKDLLTTSEQLMIARRIQIAKQLMQGQTHEAIREDLGAGYGTITQVDHWLNDGNDGYGQVLKKRKTKEQKKIDSIPPAAFSLDQLRRSCPRQYLFLNLLMAAKKKMDKSK